MSDLSFRKLLLLTVLETFWPLKVPEEKRRFEDLMETPEHRETGEFRQTWINFLTMIGRLEARRSTLLRQISVRFGPPSDEAVWKVRCLNSLDELDGHLDSVLTARSLKDMGLLDQTGSNAGDDPTTRAQEGTMSDLENYRKFLMLGLVESLSPAETPEDGRLVRDVTLNAKYRDKGVFRDTWTEELMFKGLLKGKRSILLRQISVRFGSPPDGVVRKIGRLESLNELDEHLKNVMTARSLDDMGFLGSTSSTTA